MSKRKGKIRPGNCHGWPGHREAERAAKSEEADQKPKKRPGKQRRKSASPDWKHNQQDTAMPSEKQIELLLRFNYAEELVRSLTRSEADSLIGKIRKNDWQPVEWQGHNKLDREFLKIVGQNADKERRRDTAANTASNIPNAAKAFFNPSKST